MAEANNKEMALSDKEKENLRLGIPFEKSKQFVTNINTILQTSKVFKDWMIKENSPGLKGSVLSLTFVLKDTVIPQTIEDLDKGRKGPLDKYIDPDKVLDEDVDEEED